MKTIFEALTQLFPESSKNTLRSWIEKERVYVNGKPVSKTTTRITDQDEITLGKKNIFLAKGVKILYEDKHLVVIDKPEGLLSVAPDIENALSAHRLLKNRFSNVVYPVHRLDRETSGVMVFALTESSKEHLKEKFKNHDIIREYIAVVQGHLELKKGTWTSHLVEDENYYVRSSEEGRLAITHYEVIKTTKFFSTLRVTLETGRKNQIRVHCKDAGHPIAGDKKYGSTHNPLKRLGLHAHKLGFTHPETKKELLFLSNIPF